MVRIMPETLQDAIQDLERSENDMTISVMRRIADRGQDEKFMIGQVLRDAIQEKWPFLKLECKFQSEAANELLQHNLKVVETVTDTLDIYWPLNAKRRMPGKGDEKLWVASIFITDDMLRLSIIRKKFVYENTLAAPDSLDEFYTILATHINDVRDVIPKEWHVPQYPDEPTEMELNAKKCRAAMALHTKLRVRQWGHDENGTLIGTPEINPE